MFKAGNSLAIRIPRGIAKGMDIQDGCPVQIAVDDGVISIRKAPSRALTELIERISPENLHDEQAPNLIGKERW